MLTSPLWLALTAIQIWMLVDAYRQREWLWVPLIIVGWGFAALWYYLTIYRASASPVSGYELPVPPNRRSIQSLEEQARYLDNAYNHLQLGDVYFQRGNFTVAEECYRTALNRDTKDMDTRSRLGQCLLRL